MTVVNGIVTENEYPLRVMKMLPYTAVCRNCGRNGTVYVFTYVYHDDDRPMYNHHKKYCSTECYKRDNNETI